VNQSVNAVMGIDPGVNGGLAVLRIDGGVEYLRAFQPSMTHAELVDAVRFALKCMAYWKSRTVYVEKVGSMPTDGRRAANTFGRVDGLIRGALLMAGYPPLDVSPMMWQSAMECLSGGNKNVTKKRALELFPRERITHAVADALLIAEYGRRRLVVSTPPFPPAI